MTQQQTLPRRDFQPLIPPTTNTADAKLFLVASDGLPDSDAAFAVAQLLAGTSGSVVGVAVVDQINLMPESQGFFSEEFETTRHIQLQRDVEAQMKRTLGSQVPLELYGGDPARVIAQTAIRTRATMIVAGIGQHGLPARLFGNEMALRIMRTSECPVLAVTHDMRHLPRRIIAAIDFSEPSIRALRLALTVAAPGAVLFLVHVAPRDSQLHTWNDTYKRNMLEALDAVKQKLDLPAGMIAESVLLQGDPATELLSHARSANADLIATGSHGRGFVARLLVGSVAAQLVRSSFCSVLAVPQAITRPVSTSTSKATHVATPAEWSALLNDVSRQNGGRLSILEVHDPSIGAQIEERGYSFMGASYDPYDGRVQLMFAMHDNLRRHFTRNIDGVSSIDVLQNEEARDVALRIGNRRGQTVLTFQSEVDLF